MASVNGPKDLDGPGGAAFIELYNEKYRKFIDLIDRLRAYGLEREVPLPQIAVLGVQGAGKSSVLEALSGVPLPRGTGK